MSYANGASASPVALLDSFVALLNGSGWTQDAYVADGTGKRYHGHKGTKYIHLRSFINENGTQIGNATGGGFLGSGIACVGSTAYAGSTAGFWYDQPGVPVNPGSGTNTARTAVMSLPVGAISNSWMFTDATGDNAVLVALNSFGTYTYLYFGDVAKVQAWTGGMYFGGSRPWNGAFGSGIEAQESGPPGDYLWVRANVDAYVGLWVGNNGDVGKVLTASTRHVTRGVDFGGQGISWGVLRVRSRSTFTGGVVMLPALVCVERDFGGSFAGGGLSLIGSLPEVFQTTITGIAPGATFSIGPDDYILFPQFAVRKHP